MSSSFVEGIFDGMSVKNVHYDPRLHRTLIFPADQTRFDSKLTCSTSRGVPNIDNQCVCQSSVNSTPYNTHSPRDNMGYLFVPENPHIFPDVHPVLKCLMRDRAPLHLPKEYRPKMGPCYP